MLSSFFGWCETHGITPRQSNPARGIERYQEEERERYLTPEEVQRFGDALRVAETQGLRGTSLESAPKKTVKRKLKAEVTQRQLRRRQKKADVGEPYNPDVHRPKMASAPVPADPYAVAALRFALLSGWRIGEVCALRWDAVDKVRAVATLGDTKTGRAVRPIGAAALLLLEDLPRVKDSPFVFPSSRRGLGVKSSKTDIHRPISAPRRLWEAVRDHAKLEGVRIHDLRHSFGATAADAGNSLILIASLLGHKQTRTSERYAKARRDVRQEAADEVSNELAGLMRSGVRAVK
jgi:integrase